MDKTKKILESITNGIQDKKGYGIVIANMSNIDTSICNYFVICSGNSTQQVESIATSISDYVRETNGEKPVNCTGLGNSHWVAIDYIDIMVHIFTPETRAFYDIEHLWEDADMVRLPDIDQ